MRIGATIEQTSTENPIARRHIKTPTPGLRACFPGLMSMFPVKPKRKRHLDAPLSPGRRSPIAYFQKAEQKRNIWRSTLSFLIMLDD